MPREFNTESRKDWNAVIHQCLKAIDNHNSEYFKTGNPWHLEKTQQLREYVVELKEWIIRKELNTRDH
jgi:hypothetical protein